MGLSCDLILLHEDGEKIEESFSTPNLKMVKYLHNVSVVHCRNSEAHDFIDSYLAKQTDYYWIPGGGHMAVAIDGYADVAKEILSEDTVYDAIFLPCGTGTTQAGLIYGLDDKIPVYGITVARSVDRCKDVIDDLLQCRDYVATDGEISVLPCNIPYGAKSKEVDRMIGELLRKDGIHLDPIYNGKAFLEMVRFLKNNTTLKKVLYINTGGQPNIFA